MAIFDEENRKKEVYGFLYLCSQKDRNFLSVPPRKRKAEDYVRLMSIARIFGFTFVFLRLMGEAEHCKTDIKPCVAAVKEDFPTVKSWVEDFIAGISDEGAQKLASEYWRKKLEKADAEHFIISQLF